MEDFCKYMFKQETCDLGWLNYEVRVVESIRFVSAMAVNIRFWTSRMTFTPLASRVGLVVGNGDRFSAFMETSRTPQVWIGQLELYHLLNLCALSSGTTSSVSRQPSAEGLNLAGPITLHAPLPVFSYFTRLWLRCTSSLKLSKTSPEGDCPGPLRTCEEKQG